MSSSSSLSLFLAGALSGFVEALVVQPFDMVKTRHQLNSGQNESVLQSLALIYREGGMPRFYRGFVAEAVGIIPKSSGMYATYELAKLKLASSGQFGEVDKENFGICALAGFCSGISEALIVTPTQVVKVRLQAKEHLGKYKNSFDCLSKVVSQEGLSALAIGLGPTLFRNCVWNTVYFASMFWLKGQLPAQEKGSLLDHLQTLGAGFFGAMFATCFNAPFDVVKSRVQSQLPVSAATGVTTLKYRNTLQTLGLIYREEGLAACYKGFQPKAIRMGLGGAVGMVTFEFMKNFLNE